MAEPELAEPEPAVRQRLLTAWRGEIEARYVYEALARREADPGRAGILRRIAEGEATHRQRLEARMRQLGIPIPDPASVRISPWLRLQARLAPVERLLMAREAAEDDEVAGVYGSPTGDAETDRLLQAIRLDERSHSLAVGEIVTTSPGAEAAEATVAAACSGSSAASGGIGPAAAGCRTR